MIQSYFILQYKMLNRKIRDLGIYPLLAYPILLLAFVSGSYLLFAQTPKAAYIYVLVALGYISLFSGARKNEFLKITFPKTVYLQIRIIENLIISLPFLLFLLYKQCWYLLVLLMLVSMILAMNSFQKNVQLVIPTPFFRKPFEYTIGFRNTFWVFPLLYVLVVIAISVQNFSLGIFALLLTILTTFSYYVKPEDEYYIWSYSINATQFLFEKIKTAVLYCALLQAPILIALALFYPEYGLILTLSFLWGMSLLVLIVLLKYSAYPYETNILQAIQFLFCMLLPPLLLMMLPYLFIKSKNNLKYLLR